MNGLYLHTCITWFGTINAFHKPRETGSIEHRRRKTKTNKTKTQHKIHVLNNTIHEQTQIT